MNALPGRWRVAGRLAVRDVRRAPGRTALVGALVALPVAAAVALSTLTLSATPGPQRRVADELGDAQAVVGPQLGDEVVQAPDGLTWSVNDGYDAASVVDVATYEARLAAALPPEDRLVRALHGQVRITSSADPGGVDVDLLDVPADDLPTVLTAPLHSGLLPSRPDAVVLAHRWAEELDAWVGDTVTLAAPDGTASAAVVAAVLAPGAGTPDAVTPGGSVLTPPADAAAQSPAAPRWYVLGDAPVTWAHVQAVGDVGSVVVSRDVLLDPPDVAGDDGPGPVLVAGAVGLGLLEAVLLVAPAFALGLRRSRHDHALLIAAGAERRTVRLVVLLGAAVVGAGAALAGTVLGVGVAALVRWTDHTAYPDLRLTWWHLLVAVLVGTVVATGAAWVPARHAARVDVVAALAGRRDAPRTSRRGAVLGIALVGAGVVAVLGVTVLRFSPVAPDLVLAAGALAAMVGTVLATGGLVPSLSRFAGRLGPAGRFAVRDAVRERTRTAPAVAAVVAAVAGATTTLVVLASVDDLQVRQYVGLGAPGTVRVSVQDDDGTIDPDEAARAESVLRDHLPVDEVATVSVAEPTDEVEDETVHLTVERTVEATCPWYLPEGMPRHAEPDDPRCVLGNGIGTWSSPGGSWTLADDGDAVALLGVPGAPEAAAALAAGRAVVLSPYDLWPDGTVHVVVEASPVTGGPARTLRTVTVPAVAVDLGDPLQLGLVLPPAVVTDAGMRVVDVGHVATTTRVPTVQEEEAAAVPLGRELDGRASVERGYEPVDGLTWQVTLAALLVGIAAVGMTVALAARDAAPDLEVLVQAGAGPALRRRVAAAQAGVLCAAGVTGGTLAGLLLGYLWGRARHYRDLEWVTVVPWPAVALLAVGIPLVTVAGAWLLAPGRAPRLRRTT